MNLGQLNSATKYPSIETYHAIDPANGKLFDQGPAHFWQGPVVLTEKVDGTGTRVILPPGGDYFIGSREEIIYAKGDRIESPALGIVAALKPFAEKACQRDRDFSARHGITWVFYLEVYGSKIGGAAKQYTAQPGVTGHRLFDVAGIPADVLTWEREKIASWREHGGQSFLVEETLKHAAVTEEIGLVPRLGHWDSSDLPATLAGMSEFLHQMLHRTNVALDETAGGRPEGLVLRSEDRSLIAKARFQDYARTLGRKQ